MHDVAIVGFGPTGAVAAGLLGRLGIKTLVLDRSEGIYDKPRAIALDHEVMRVFQELGVVDEIAPYIAAYPASEYRGVDGRVIKRLDTAPPPYPLGWLPNLSFTQPPVEKALRASVARQHSVQVDLGVELTGIRQNGSSVTLELQADSRRYTEQARYVIGCDGANSTVRRLAAIDLEDLGFDEPWLVVDVQVGKEALERLPAVNVQYCEPSRPATHVVGPGNHRRWEIMLHEDEDPQRLAEEASVWKLLDRWLKPGEATLWRSATYRFHALIARSWRAGNVFLAGDAAHQQPPFLGQGMCQGIRDAANLAWKLHSVIRQDASQELLDTYELERAPHVRRLIGIIKGLGRFVCERDPIRARQRDEKLIAEMGGAVKTTLRQELVPPIEQGFLASAAHGPTGTPFPQPWISDRGARLDDVVGTGFRLVAAAAVSDEDLCGANSTSELPLRVVRVVGEDSAGVAGGAIPTVAESDGVVADWFRRHQCVAALVRPDHYVFGVAPRVAAIEGLVSECRRMLAARSFKSHQRSVAGAG